MRLNELPERPDEKQVLCDSKGIPLVEGQSIEMLDDGESREPAIFKVTGWREGHHSGSTGRIYVTDSKGTDHQYYPSVFDCGWVPESYTKPYNHHCTFCKQWYPCSHPDPEKATAICPECKHTMMLSTKSFAQMVREMGLAPNEVGTLAVVYHDNK